MCWRTFDIFTLLSIFCTQHVMAEQEHTQLLFSDETTIYMMDTETRSTTTIAVEPFFSKIFYVDYHFDKGLIFWSDFKQRKISRIRFPLQDGVRPEQVSLGSVIAGIAVDHVNDYLYWNQHFNGNIYRSNLDGTSVIKIIQSPDRLWDIELDHLQSWIYFTANDGRSMRRCRFDGSELETVVDTFPDVVNGFTIDMENNLGIYGHFNFKTVFSFPMNDASDTELIADVSEYIDDIWDVAVDSSSIFLTGGEGVYKLFRNKPLEEPEKLFTGVRPTKGVKVFKQKDVFCPIGNSIYNAERRSIDYKLSSENTPISDHDLKPAWYKIISENGDGMATTPPGVNFCGTQNPIWVNGSLPDSKKPNVTVTACIQTETSICQHSFDVEIRICDSFFLYSLQNTTENSAYCFGSGSVRCDEGLSSESGFYPGCSSSYPNETVYPVVNGMLQYGEVYNINQNDDPSLIPVFHCKFEDVSNGQMYFYDILWYIDDNLVAHRRNILFENVSSSNLKGNEWNENYYMNMEVKCGVRLRFGVDSVPGPVYNSSVFHAGLIPEKKEYTVIEGQSVTIRLTATMPVGCTTNNTDYRAEQCKRQIYVYVPNSRTGSSSCSNAASNKDLLLSSCGITLKSLDDQQAFELIVYGVSDGLYNSGPRHAYIKALPTNSTLPSVIDIWSSLNLLEIKVTVLDKDSTLSGRLCQSYNDPHITTFDGKTYHYMAVGEFVMYRNDRGPYWVHALFTNCGNGWTGSSCHCGIAIRSRNSLFIFRTCQSVSKTQSVFLRQPHIEARSCNDGDLKIIQNGQSYQITLPIGTEIQFTVSFQFISRITIKPSISDINEARGLCGVPSEHKDPTDDFINRDTDKVSSEKEFADSWRITPEVRQNEQLFVLFPTFDIDNGNDPTFDIDNGSRYCVCDADSSHCNLTQLSGTCSGSQNQPSNSGFVSSSCEVQSNRKKRSTLTLNTEHTILRRSVDDSDDIIDIPPFTLDDGVGKNNNISIDDAEFRNGWTEVNASKTCSEQITTENLEENFEKFGGVSIDDYINSCVLDIKITATTEFLKDTVGAIQTYILIEVLRNETIINSTADGGKGSLLEDITNQLCPGNCSSHGTCTMGKCNCINGFVGDDCSEDVTLPPLHISLPANGLCGKETRACKRTNINGYFPSENVTCRIKYSQILTNTVTETQERTVNAEYRNPYMVTVNLDMDSRNRRAASETPYLTVDRYELSLSNDGTTFGDTVVFIAYNEKCNFCDNMTKICTIISSCPYITTTESTTTVKQQTFDYLDESLWMSVIFGSVFTVAVIIIIIVCIVMRTRRLKSTKKYRSKKAKEIRGGWRVYQRKRPVVQRYPIQRPTRPYFRY